MEVNHAQPVNNATDNIHKDSPEDAGYKGRESISDRRLRYLKLLLIILGTTVGYQNEGLSSTWPNVFASDFQSDRTTLFNTSLQVTDWQLDMMSSSLYIGTMPAIVISGWLVSWLGRKQSMLLTAVPGVISWIIIALAPTTAVVLAGRFINGASYGLLGIAVRSYLAEVTDVRIRGAAGVTTEAMKGIGGIAVIALGIFMPWYFVAFVCGCHFLVYGLLIIPFLPESPTHLAITGKEDEAKQILRFLGGPTVDVEDIIKKLKKENKRADGSQGWRVLLKPDILKKYFIIVGLFFISNFCGVEVIRGNATRMLLASGLAIDRDISTIIVFAVLLSGNISQTLILDWIGRRKCLVLSLLLLLISYTLLGTYVYLDSSHTGTDFIPKRTNMTLFYEDERFEGENNWSWVPTACLMLCAFGSSLGIGPIPWLLSAEYFPTTIRPQLLAVCSISANVMTIASLQLYSPLQALLTQAGLYWCYASFSALGIIYSIAFVNETKGLSIG